MSLRSFEIQPRFCFRGMERKKEGKKHVVVDFVFCWFLEEIHHDPSEKQGKSEKRDFESVKDKGNQKTAFKASQRLGRANEKKGGKKEK